MTKNLIYSKYTSNIVRILLLLLTSIILFFTYLSKYGGELVGKSLLCNKDLLITFTNNTEAYLCWKEQNNYPHCEKPALYSSNIEEIFLSLEEQYNDQNYYINRIDLKGFYNDKYVKQMGLRCRVATSNEVTKFQETTKNDLLIKKQKAAERELRKEQFREFQEREKKKKLEEIKNKRKI